MEEQAKEKPVKKVRDKTLRDKAINFRGKQYVMVADRVIYFNDTYPMGSIVTEILSLPDAERVVMKATISPDQQRFYVGHSQAKWGEGHINKNAALENAETSAVGRALALMGIGVLDSIASIDEINKANGAAASNSEAKVAEHEEAFDQREEGEKTLAVFQMDGIQQLAKTHGRTEAQLIAYMKQEFKVDRIEKVLRRDFPKLKEFVLGKTQLQDDLQGSVEMVKSKKPPIIEAKQLHPTQQDWARLYAVAGKNGIPEADVKRYYTETFNVESGRDLLVHQFKQIQAWVESV